MPAKRSNLVEEYIAAQPAAVRRALKRVRAVIRKALPSAQEVISYHIPAYKVNGRIAIFFAGWREHYAIYPGSGSLVSIFKEELRPYKVSKGTIRFELDKPVPARLIERIATYRAKEVSARAKSTVAQRKKR